MRLYITDASFSTNGLWTTAGLQILVSMLHIVWLQSIRNDFIVQLKGSHLTWL